MLMSCARIKIDLTTMVKYWGQFLIISTTILFILFYFDLPLYNQLLIPPHILTCPRLPIGFYYSVKLPSHLVLSLNPNLPCPMLLSIYLFVSTPSIIPPLFFCAAWAFTFFNTPLSINTPTRFIIRFQKEKVPYHSIRLLATATEGQLFLYIYHSHR